MVTSPYFKLKILATIASIAFANVVIAQADTVVIKEYSNILITTDYSGEIKLVTDINQVREAGFFLNGIPDGLLRVCNENEIFGWVDGKLVFSLTGCDFFEPKNLFQFAESDTVFVSFSTSSGFENFRCELIFFEDFKVLREEVAKPRDTRNLFHEFNIITIILLLFFFAVFSTSFPARLEFFLSKTYSLRANSYHFISTDFFGRANMMMALSVCLSIAFEVIYIDEQLDLDFFLTPVSLMEYFELWVSITLWILLFFFAKRFLIQIIANLFSMRKLRDWQLFDLINFVGYFALILFVIVLLDFIWKSSGESWINIYFLYYFMVVLLLFELWFVTKFVTNSSYQKLLIISYLCATEIIPFVFLMVWFFK